MCSGPDPAAARADLYAAAAYFYADTHYNLVSTHFHPNAIPDADRDTHPRNKHAGGGNLAQR